MKKGLFVCLMVFISVCLFANGQQEVQAVNPEDYASTALEGYPIEGLGWNVTSDVKADEKYTIACVVKNNTNPWMAGFSGGFEKAAESMGFEPIVLSPAKNDNIEEQARVVDDLIQRQVDGIVISPIDSNGIVPCLERAYAAGIPVIVVGTAANTDQIFGFIGTQYYEQGKYIAEYIAEALDGNGNVINLPGPPEAQNAHERNAGIHEVLDKYPNINIIAEQPSNFRRTDGLTVTENLIQKYSEDEIDAIIASNDEAAMGVIMALEGAGYKVGSANDGIIVAGFDCNEDASYAIQQGRLEVSINPDPPSLGWLGAAYIVQYLNDGTLCPEGYIPYPDLNTMDGVIVDGSNIDYYIDEVAWWKQPSK